jgi:hypothetical protein
MYLLVMMISIAFLWCSLFCLIWVFNFVFISSSDVSSFQLSTRNGSLAVEDIIRPETVKFTKVSRFSGIVRRITKSSTNHKLGKRGVDLMNRFVEGFCEGGTINRDSW